jgi:hypothetical protein
MIHKNLKNRKNGTAKDLKNKESIRLKEELKENIQKTLLDL